MKISLPSLHNAAGPKVEDSEKHPFPNSSYAVSHLSKPPDYLGSRSRGRTTQPPWKKGKDAREHIAICRDGGEEYKDNERQAGNKTVVKLLQVFLLPVPNVLG